MQSRQQRLNPSKLLVLLMYGTYPYLDVETIDGETRQLTLEIGPFARLMRVKNGAISEYLQWLEQMGYLTITSCSNKTITVIVTIPTLFRKVI